MSLSTANYDALLPWVLQLEKWSLQEASNLLWSVAVCQKTQHPGFGPLVRLVARGLPPTITSPGDALSGTEIGGLNDMRQLFQVGQVRSIRHMPVVPVQPPLRRATPHPTRKEGRAREGGKHT